MPKLTGSQVYQLARGAGLSEQEASIATALAYAESGYNTDAHGVGPADDSYGLWQINLHKSVGDLTTLLRQYGISKPADLYDPATNARVMVQIYRARGWERPWAGSWRKIQSWRLADWHEAGVPLSDAGAAGDDTQVTGAPLAASPYEQLASGFGDLVPALGKFLAWLINPSNWRRLGIGVLGIGLVVLAVALANRGLLAGAATTAITKGAS